MATDVKGLIVSAPKYPAAVGTGFRELLRDLRGRGTLEGYVQWPGEWDADL